MVRRRRSSVTHPQPLSYNVSKDAALRVISSYLNFLLEKKKLIERRVEVEGEVVYEEMYKKEEVTNHINLLNKIKVEISSTENHNPLSVVAQHLQEVHQKRALISEAEEYLCLGISLLMRQQKVLPTKPGVMHQIDMLEKIFKEISLVQLPLTSGQRVKEVEEYHWPPLMMRLREFRGFAEICEYRDSRARAHKLSRDTRLPGLRVLSRRSFQSTRVYPAGEYPGEVDEYQLPPLILHGFNRIAEICEYRIFCARAYELSPNTRLLPGLRVFLDMLGFLSMGVSRARECPEESIRKRVVTSTGKFRWRSKLGRTFWRSKAVRNLQFKLSMNEIETREVINRVELGSLNKQRYLCITNGFEIFCLDLKRGKDQTFNNADDVPPLPKIATLKLCKDPLPVASLGLFNWNKNAYVICRKVVNSMSDDNPSDIYCRTIGKWAYLLEKLYEEGSACDIHRFSPADDSLTISHSEFNISKPNKPKFWPIVENIDDQIHLIDSLPKRIEGVCDVWTFSHEVLDPKRGTWMEITSPLESLLHINCHLVVGRHIFATSPVDLYFENQKRSYLVFDSKTKEWKPSQRRRHTYAIKDVWDILELGPARCAGGFPYGQPSDPLYVIIALQPDNTNYKDGTWAVAYLVTSMGQVVCIQVLRDFFAGPVWPCYMYEGKLIEVAGMSRTMCSIVIASAWDHSSLEYVFVNTFTVEELHVASQIRQLLAKGSKAWPVEQDFVRVDVKDNCIYKKNGGLEEDDSDRWVGVQACFL